MRRPLNIIMDLTSRCNLGCTMCYFSATDQLHFEPYDVESDERGTMSLQTFATVAEELFPRARRVALACAAEPLMHPRFADVLAVAARHRVPDLWFPTNLLLLTTRTAEAIVEAGVRTVAVSVDGTDGETYERIRRGGRWDRFLSRLDLLAEVKRTHGSRQPALRFIFTWMRSNRDHLRRLPAFAAEHGACELDVRFVTPTVGIDVGPELLDGEDRGLIDAELEATAHDAVSRGIRLSSYPSYSSTHSRSVTGKIRHRLWLLRAGLDRPEYWRHRWREHRHGCGYPRATLLVRPNGAVLPCPFWESDPIGLMPRDTADHLLGSALLGRITAGLACNRPVGTCTTCDQRRDAFYRPQMLGR